MKKSKMLLGIIAVSLITISAGSVLNSNLISFIDARESQRTVMGTVYKAKLETEWLYTRYMFNKILRVSELNRVELIRHKSNSFIMYSTETRSGMPQVHVSDGAMMFLLKDKNWLALVLAHELSHIIHGETGNVPNRAEFCSSSPANSRKCEKDADLFGKVLTKRAGYNPCVGPELFMEFKKVFGTSPNPSQSTHPTDDERATYMQCFYNI